VVDEPIAGGVYDDAPRISAGAYRCERWLIEMRRLLIFPLLTLPTFKISRGHDFIT